MRFRPLLTLIVLLMSAAPAAAGLSGSDLYLISVGRGSGASGSFWYTTVWIHNPGSSPAPVTASLLYRDQQNSSPEQQTLDVLPGETLKLGDVLLDLFGVEAASGALRFRAPEPIVVSSRIFNQTGDAIAESQGQFMAGMPAEIAFGAAAATDIPGITQPVDGSFRCNFAMVETAGGNCTVQMALYDGSGGERASKTYYLRPYEPIQKNLSDLGGGVAVDGGRLRFEVLSGSGRVLSVASMVGNGLLSQDPSTLEMEIETPTGSGGGDITGVNAGEGLAGGGTSGDVSLRIDTAGAAAGQILAFDGVGVGWSAVSDGLTLPYSGSSPAGGAVFKVVNTSTAGNVSGLRGESASNAGSAVFGWAMAETGLTSGVYGQNSSQSGTGVFGLNANTTGTTYGVYGIAASPESTAVFGQNLSTSDGAGGLGPIGVAGEAGTLQGIGVVGKNTATDSHGMLGWFYRGGYFSGNTGIEAHGRRQGGYFQVNDEDGELAINAAIYTAGGTGVRSYGQSFDFLADGPGADYGPFTGAHEVRLAVGFPEVIETGLIVSAAGPAERRLSAGGEIDLSTTLPTVELSREPRDARVLGVLVSERHLPTDHWFAADAEPGDRFAIINALGEGRMWVTDGNGEISIGDYVTTSTLPGYGQRQDDDLLRSSTVAKVVEAVDWNTVTDTVEHNGRQLKRYLIAVVYTSG